MRLILSLTPQVQRMLVLLVVVGNLAFSIVYNNFQTFDPKLPRGQAFADADLYIDLYYGQPAEELRNPYRILVPFLARLVPDPLLPAFNSGRQLDALSRAAFKFAVVNFTFLVGIGFVLFALMRGLGFSMLEGITAGVLFLSLTHVVRAGGGPVAETGYWFFLSLATLAIQRQNVRLLAIATIIGLFAKEQMIWVALLTLLAPLALQRKLLLLGVLALSAIIYVAWRLCFDPASAATASSLIPRIWANLVRSPTPNDVLTIVLTFGLLWIPALFALWRCALPLILRRWAWFVPALIFFNWIMGLGNVRHTTAAFVVVIPLTVIGLRAWLGSDADEP